MKLKYNIRLLVQYEIKADSFNEAMLRANRNVMPNNGDVVQYHYIDKNEKRYVFDYHNMSLTEVDTFGSIKPLTVVETSLGCLAPPAPQGASQPINNETADEYNNRNRIS